MKSTTAFSGAVIITTCALGCVWAIGAGSDGIRHPALLLVFLLVTVLTAIMLIGEST